MKRIKIKLSGQEIILVNELEEACSVFKRMKGLMFRDNFKNGAGMLITPCNSIHTFFMKFPIDVLFLNSNFKIIKIIRSITPWKITWTYWRATQVLELPSGTLPLEIKEGLILEVENV